MDGDLKKLQQRIMSDEDDKQRILDVMKSLSINGQWFKRQLGVLIIIMIGII